jgi:hypothetical protein
LYRTNLSRSPCTFWSELRGAYRPPERRQRRVSREDSARTWPASSVPQSWRAVGCRERICTAHGHNSAELPPSAGQSQPVVLARGGPRQG